MLFKVQRHSTRKSSLKRFRFSTASQFALISISLQFLAEARELFSVLTSRIMIEKEKRGRTGPDCENKSFLMSREKHFNLNAHSSLVLSPQTIAFLLSRHGMAFQNSSSPEAGVYAQKFAFL